MSTAAQSLRRLESARDSGALAELCRRQAIDLLVLFGSAASRGDASPGPDDIDLAISFRPGADHDLLAAIDALAELVGGDHLDVMHLASAGPVAMHRALTTGEVLYAADPHLFAERQIFAINHYIETAPLRRDTLRSLARCEST